MPESWIRESTARLVPAPAGYLGSHAVDYGYLWWLLALDDPMNPRAAPLATSSRPPRARARQWIFAVPRLALVVDRDGGAPTTARGPRFRSTSLYTHIILPRCSPEGSDVTATSEARSR